jgi:signal transduction histidine kinase
MSTALKSLLRIQLFGINQDDLNKIFEDFLRIEKQKKRNITGARPGLSIVKELVYSYQGKIKVTSQPDQGSKFNIRLPIDQLCS